MKGGLHLSSNGLGSTLSKWLAIQTFVGLGIICVSVYLTIAVVLSQRQDTTLDQKQAAVSSLLTEEDRQHTREELRHLLRDVLAGHAELTLQIRDESGNVFWAPKPDTSVPTRFSSRLKTRKFQLAANSLVQGAATETLNLELTLDPSADDALLSYLAWTLGCGALLGSVAVSLGAFRLVRQGLLPIHRLVEQTRTLTVNELDRRLDGSGQPLELQPLIRQFNDLLQRLADAYRQMEAFNADVAHELNTPLSNLISSCELTLRRERSAAEMQEALGSNLEDLRRMAGIVGDMLFLSLADRAPNVRRTQVSSLAELVHEVIDFHEASLHEEGLQAEVSGDCAASVDNRLLRRAISNLLGNATRYAKKGSTIQVSIDEPSDGFVSIMVSNAGPAIEPNHLPRIFDRFYRADPARAFGDRNHGLGLAIVAAIARMHGGAPHASSGDGVTRVGFTVKRESPFVSVTASHSF